MMAIAIRYVGCDRLHIEVRGHELFTEQPVDDSAPTPTELFVAG